MYDVAYVAVRTNHMNVLDSRCSVLTSLVSGVSPDVPANRYARTGTKLVNTLPSVNKVSAVKLR
jgi:hypothetical protein